MFGFRREQINKTGIGLAGIDGLWWLPACRPFALPQQVATDLAAIGVALFAFYDVVTELYDSATDDAADLHRLLNFKVPPTIPRLPGRGPILALRPDCQLVPLAADGQNIRSSYRVTVTELEMCPSAQGFAHAMQVGYGLPADLVNGFVELLDGRELRLVCSARWSEFLFEQLAFCRALNEAGGRATLYFDGSLARLAAEVRYGRRWQPPLFGISQKPAHWADDLPGRLKQHGFAAFLWPDGAAWPEEGAGAVIFRFGYMDCFTPAATAQLALWHARGATFLNPPFFFLDSKVVMAAWNLPMVRRRLAAVDPAKVELLDRTIPETVLLLPEDLARFLDDKDSWVIKYAAFDGNDQAWGGRSVAFGAEVSRPEWQRRLQTYAALPWPVVAQRVAPSAVVDMAYLDPAGDPCLMAGGRTRLRVFLLRSRGAGGETAVACGAHLTVSGAGLCVAEATDTVQAPVIYYKEVVG
jgi:hypothetical protein